LKEYSPKRRTALILAGTGTAGAYHAGVLRALDESGVKIDLLVGSGAGAVAAAYGAVAGGAKLYGPGGFWDGVRGGSFFALRPLALLALVLLGLSFAVFLMPLALALVAGLLFPLVLIADRVAPGLPSRALGRFWVAPEVLSGPYLAALALPIFALAATVLVFLVRSWLRDGRRFPESFESFLSERPGQNRLRRGLWEIARGPALSRTPPSEAELGERFVALAAENLGQPGFRELILRTADLDGEGVLPFVLLQDEHRTAFAAARARQPRSRLEGIPGAVDLRAPGYGAMLFEAVMTGLLPPLAAPVRRVAFPKGGLFGGETHRLSDATLVMGAGLSEALAAGAEQVIVASATPASAAPLPRRRGARAQLESVLAALERQALERDVQGAERINRMVETLGHRTEDGGRAWQDPATLRVYRDFALYVVRPERRFLGPLELGGARDPATEVWQTTADLLEQGYRDAYRVFVEPVVGAAPVAARAPGLEAATQPVQL
jgi:hypothetical protein